MNSILVYIKSGYHSRFLKKTGNHVIICRGVSFEGEKYVSMGDDICIGKRTVITAWKTGDNDPQISINSNVNIGDDCHITSSNIIMIGQGTLLGKKVTITDNSHGDITISDLRIIPHHRQIVSKGPVIIGERVWIGDKATILPNVTIGEGSIIGANAVVTKDIPQYSVAVGNPAKVVKQLL